MIIIIIIIIPFDILYLILTRKEKNKKNSWVIKKQVRRKRLDMYCGYKKLSLQG